MGQPDFICIGAQKAATTWLARNLGQHPGVWLPFAKELHCFDLKDQQSLREWRRRHAANLARKIEKARQMGALGRIAYLEGLTGEDFILTDDWYRKVFAHRPKGAITGEFTPRYATIDETAIDRLLSLAPDARFIYLIREPVERAISQFRMHVERTPAAGRKPETIDAAARAWAARRAYLASDYAAHIPRWESKVQRERILYLPFGKVRSAPFELLGEVERFLGLRTFPDYPRAKSRVHASRRAEPPAWLRAHLAADLAPQAAFLKERFPPEFVAALG